MSKLEKGRASYRKGRAKTGGRQKGTPNKTTALLKDAILQAATAAGGKEGLVGYLQTQAVLNPSAFIPLLGKVLPLQISGEEGKPLAVTFTTVYEGRED